MVEQHYLEKHLSLDSHLSKQTYFEHLLLDYSL